MDEADVRFSPSLNQQRYEFVTKLINESECKIITDVGCSECNLVEKIKFLCPKVEIINCIDIDESTLEFNINKTQQIISDSLFPRPNKLETFVYVGSIEKFDIRCYSTEFLCAIEIIEHLHPEQIINFNKTIFKKIEPKIVIISTPNREFNIVFKNGIKTNNNQCRHYDHKFEWTRSQFKYYCDLIKKEFNYDYKITGVGQATNSQYINIGYCTQIAIFTKNYQDKNNLDINNKDYFPYKLISWEIFPTLNIKFENDLINKINLIKCCFETENNKSIICNCQYSDKICLNIEQFYKINYTKLNKYFFSYQQFYDFLKFHTRSLINKDLCFIFKEKSILTSKSKVVLIDSENESSSNLNSNSNFSDEIDEFNEFNEINEIFDNTIDNSEEWWD